MPTTNTFFNSTYPGQSAEQSLIDDLVIEQIAIYGLDILYMPRRMLNLDKLLHESSKAAFELALPIPMYLKSFTGYQNGMEILSKFGVRSSDEITLVMSRSQFTSYYAPFIKAYHNQNKGADIDDQLNHLEGETDTRPKEGDLIYFPFDDGIFEIKYVSFDTPFFQLGRGYVFELQCEKFEYSGETFDTGYDEVDDSMALPDYYRMEFNTQTDGHKTFEFKEPVIIYDISDLNAAEIVTDSGDYILAENYRIVQNVADSAFLKTEKSGPFRLYKDPGYVHQVPMVNGTVMSWDKTQGKLVVGDLSDLDPDQMSRETYDIDWNKFDEVLIVGQTTGATYASFKAVVRESAFDDSTTIQDEFNQIKIFDVADENPFGFV